MAGHGTVSPRRGSLGGLVGAPVWRDRALLQPHAGLGGDGTEIGDGRDRRKGGARRNPAQRRAAPRWRMAAQTERLFDVQTDSWMCFVWFVFGQRREEVTVMVSS